MKIKIDINFKVSKLIRNYIFVDLAINAAWGFLGPIFPIFIIDKISGATLGTVGLAAAIYLIIKSAVQLPIANFLDKIEGEKDDFYALVVSLILSSFTAFAFLAVRSLTALYLVQAIHAIAFAIYTPAWSGVFSRHLDKSRYSFDWSLDSTAIGFAAGISGLIGGLLANWFGYSVVFILVGIFSLISIIFLITIPKLILPEPVVKKSVGIPDHRPPAMG